MENKESLQKKQIANKICLLVRNTDDTALNFEQLLSEILAEEHPNINYPVSNGWTAMHFACFLGKKQIIKTLLKYGAMLHEPKTTKGSVPIDFIKDLILKKEIITAAHDWIKIRHLYELQGSCGQEKMLSPVEEFITKLIFNYNQEKRELAIIQDVGNDDFFLKKRYGLDTHQRFDYLFCTIPLKEMLQKFCSYRINLYQELIDILISITEVNLIDEVYRVMWVVSQRLMQKINNLLAEAKQHDIIVEKNELDFALASIDAFYADGLKLLENHISIALKYELQYTEIKYVVGGFETQSGLDEIYMLIKIREFYDDILEPASMQLLDLHEAHRANYELLLQDDRLADPLVYIYESGFALSQQAYEMVLQFLKENQIKSKDLQWYRENFVKLSELYEKIVLHCNIYNEYAAQLQKNKEIASYVENVPVPIVKAIKDNTRDNINIEDNAENNTNNSSEVVISHPTISLAEYHQQQTNKLQSWKMQIEQRKKSRILSTSTISLCKEIKKASNKYLATYVRGSMINPNFNLLWANYDKNMLERVLAGVKLLTISEVRSFIASISGKTKLSTKNHLIYFIPDLYAVGIKIKYITDGIALPTKSNAKNDASIADCYIVNLKNNLLHAGFDKTFQQAINVQPCI